MSLQDTYTEGSGGGTGVLSSVPSALCRWTEEARVLDGDSMHDCMTGLKPQLVEDLEKHRDSELAERKEKRKKAAEEEAAKKEKEKKEKGEKGESRPSSLQEQLEQPPLHQGAQSLLLQGTPLTTSNQGTSVDPPAQDNDAMEVETSQSGAEGNAEAATATTTASSDVATSVTPATTSSISQALNQPSVDSLTAAVAENIFTPLVASEATPPPPPQGPGTSACKYT